MDWDTLHAVLDQLRCIAYRGRFSPYLMNEPLLDPRLLSIVELARSLLPSCLQYVSTNGDLLTPARGRTLFEAGLDRMTVNCYDGPPDHLSQLDGIVQKLVESVRGLRRFDNASFQEMVRGPLGDKMIALRDCRHGLPDSLTNRAGNVRGGRVLESPLQANCFRPFRQLYVRYNGDVVLCCCDWKGEVVFGNVASDTLAGAYDSALATRYRYHLARENRCLSLCSGCDFSGDQD